MLSKHARHLRRLVESTAQIAVDREWATLVSGMNDQQDSKSARELMEAMETGAFTLQEIAEAFSAMDDDALEELGRLLRERHGKPMVPRASP
jgi:hypothetical protein